MDYEKNEKKFIVAYETTLADEGREICKEVDSTSFVNNELLIEKAVMYCKFISSQKDVDPKLVEKCKNYVNNAINFNRYKNTFHNINIYRREKEKCFDMRNMRVKNNL